MFVSMSLNNVIDVLIQMLIYNIVSALVSEYSDVDILTAAAAAAAATTIVIAIVVIY
jgi:hypothetical protein